MRKSPKRRRVRRKSFFGRLFSGIARVFQRVFRNFKYFINGLLLIGAIHITRQLLLAVGAGVTAWFWMLVWWGVMSTVINILFTLPILDSPHYGP